MENEVRSERDALLLAVVDMEQTIAAAQMLSEQAQRPGDTFERTSRLQALEAAIAVCYVRPLRGKLKDTIRVAEEEVLPKDPALRKMHDTLVLIRDKVYAHTDRELAPRSFAFVTDPPGLEYRWLPIPAEAAEQVIALAEHQRDRFLEMAGRAAHTP